MVLINHPLFILVTFLGVAITSLVLGMIRIARYKALQPEIRLLFFAANNVFMAIAFGIGGLLSAPHPASNFRYLLPVARAAWGLFFVTLVLSTCIDWWSLDHLYKERIKAWKKNNVIP